MSLSRLAPLSAALVALVAASASAQPFQGIPDVPGWDDTIVANVSADGRVLVGFVRDYTEMGTRASQAFRWEAGTLTLLGTLPGHTYSEAVGVSADGAVVVGTSCAGDGEGTTLRNTCRGVRWTGTAATALPFMDADIGEGDSHEAFAVSASGAVVVGYLSEDVEGERKSGPVRWAGGPPALAMGDQWGVFPHAVSDDGSVIAAASQYSQPQRGDLYGYSASELYRVVGQTATLLPLPAGAAGGAVLGMSGDGSVVVGSVRDGDNNNRPVRWGPTGLEELPLPDSALYGGIATAASADGSVIVGNYLVEGFDKHVAVWRDGVFSDVAAELRARGVDLGGVRLSTPNGVSADGTVVVGRAFGTGDVSSYRIELGGVAFTAESAFMKEDSLFWPDTTYTLRWRAPVADRLEIHASLLQDPDPENDAHWPIVVATGIDGTTEELNWTVPVEATSPTVRLRLRDADDPAQYAVSERARVRYGWHLTRVVTDPSGEQRYERFAPERHAWQDGLTEATWAEWVDGYGAAFAEKRDEVATDLLGRAIENGPTLDEALWGLRRGAPFTFRDEDEPGGAPSATPTATLTATPKRSYLHFRQARAERIPNVTQGGHYRVGTPSWRGFVHAYGVEAVYGSEAVPTPAIGLDPERAEVSPVVHRLAAWYAEGISSGSGMCYGLAYSALVAFQEPDAFAARYRALYPALQSIRDLSSVPITPQALDVIASAFTVQALSGPVRTSSSSTPLYALMDALATDDPADDFALTSVTHAVLPFRVDPEGEAHVVRIHDRTYPSPAGRRPFPNGTRTSLVGTAEGRIHDSEGSGDPFYRAPERIGDFLQPMGAPATQDRLLAGYRNEVEFAASAGASTARTDGSARLGGEPEPIVIFRDDPTLPPIGYTFADGGFGATVRATVDEGPPELTVYAADGVTLGYRSDGAAGAADAVAYDPAAGLALTAQRDGALYGASLSTPVGGSPSHTGGEDRLSAEVGPLTADAGQTLRWAWEDAGSPSAGVRVENGAGAQTYSVALVRGNEFFVADDVAMGAGAVHTLRPDWGALASGPLSIHVDDDSDGTDDRTITVTNSLPTPGEAPPEAVEAVALGVPYPNPARSGPVTVSVDLPEHAWVRLTVYDALGREVAVALDGPLAAGRHPLVLDVSRFPAGAYAVRLQTGDEVVTQRLTVVR